MRVAVLCGGRSHERAVSLRSGARVEHALHALGHDAVLLDADVDTRSSLESGRFDVVFIALHGRGGEDDAVQLMCEQLDLPYTGSRAGPCGAAFHKVRAKRLLLAADVSTPPFVACSERAIEEQGPSAALAEAASLGLPVVVKPARAGSALGTRFVDDAADLPRALISAFSYDHLALIERHVAGRELSVAVLGTPGSDAGVRVLPPVEIVPRHAQWFDYESRYSHGETEFTCPPVDLPDAAREQAELVAAAAYEALDQSGFGRVDMILDAGGTPWVLEAAPVPGLTDTGPLSIACAAAGIAFEALVARLLEDALEQHDGGRRRAGSGPRACGAAEADGVDA